MQETIEKLEQEIDTLRDKIRWFEFESGQGSSYLTEEMYEDAVADGSWEPDLE